MIRDYLSKADVKKEPRCSRCDAVLSCAACVGCGKSLDEESIVYCGGTMGQTFHRCKDCAKKPKVSQLNTAVEVKQ